MIFQIPGPVADLGTPVEYRRCILSHAQVGVSVHFHENPDSCRTGCSGKPAQDASLGSFHVDRHIVRSKTGQFYRIIEGNGRYVNRGVQGCRAYRVSRVNTACRASPYRIKSYSVARRIRDKAWNKRRSLRKIITNQVFSRNRQGQWVRLKKHDVLRRTGQKHQECRLTDICANVEHNPRATRQRDIPCVIIVACAQGAVDHCQWPTQHRLCNVAPVREAISFFQEVREPCQGVHQFLEYWIDHLGRRANTRRRNPSRESSAANSSQPVQVRLDESQEVTVCWL